MTPELYPGIPGSPPNLGALSERCESLVSPLAIKLGFASVTNSGLRRCRNSFPAVFDSTRNHAAWLIGVYHAITQPSALRHLIAKGTDVRIFTAGANSLTYGLLDQPPQFHPKTLCVSDNEENGSGFLYVSSANLTGSAYGESSQNIELGLLTPLSSSLFKSFNGWWTRSWDNALAVTPTVVDAYADLREEFLERNPDLPHGAEPPPAEDVREADVLWIEAGAMSGGSRNQIEFNRELAQFFGEPENQRRDLTILIGDRRVTGKPLTPKTTTYGVDIWRLSLPTSEEGGPEYPHRVIQLSKEMRDGEQVFTLTVEDGGSDSYREWKSLSNQYGHVGRTSGRRQFGFYSRADS